MAANGEYCVLICKLLCAREIHPAMVIVFSPPCSVKLSVQVVVRGCRQAMGRWNLAKKTLVDKRFLI